MPEKPEMTREQLARIELLTIEHGKVTVHPVDEHSICKVEFAGRALMLDEDGEETIPPLESIPFRLPAEMVKRLLGADTVDAMIVQRADSPYPDHAVGGSLQAAIEARIAELLATSEAVREVDVVAYARQSNPSAFTDGE